MNLFLKTFSMGVLALGLTVSSVVAKEWRFNNFLPETQPSL